LVQLWNQCFTGRGATILRGTMLIEYFLFAKAYFDPEGLLLALDDSKPVGFVHAGFGPGPGGATLDRSTGIICALGVVPEYHRKGVGAELLRRAEDYLRCGGATTLLAGAMSPLNPFTFAIYGGSDSPGFLDSDPSARPFFEKQGYKVRDTVLVMHRRLEEPLALVDVRFSAYRQRLEIHARSLPAVSWWQESVIGPIEMVEYLLVDKAAAKQAARAVLWEMETFRPRWEDHAVGVLGLEVLPELRRQGLGKFLLAQILRHLQEQYFTLAEMQVAEDNVPALELARLLGFQSVDSGRRFVR
jgi:ribosomal protein S18 acetylase RimI-like enzyme